MNRLRKQTVSVAVALIALASGVAGCSGSGSSQGTSSGGGLFSGIFGTRRNPNAELTNDEGRKLLLEIRKDPSRLQKLTPPERRFLARANAAKNDRDSDR